MNAAATAPVPDTGLKHPGLISLINACDILLPGGQKLALIAIARCRDTRTGRSVISFETIGKRSGLGKKQASRHVEALMGRGLISRVGMLGKCYVYTIDVESLARAETCKKQSGEPVDNSDDTPDISDTDPGHLAPPPRTFEPETPDMGVHHSGGSGFYSGEGSEAREADAVDALDAAALPSPFLEDPKTEQPWTAVDDVLAGIADQRAAGLPIGGQQIRDLIEAANASGEVPLDVAADAVRGCLVAVEAPALAELVTPAQPIVTPPAPIHPAPALAVAISPDTLAAVNAQRVRNGKGAFKRAELLDLHREATLAGIAPQAAAEWILARPSRSFLLARQYRPEPTASAAPAAPTGPVELTAAGRAAQAQIARALAAPAAAAFIVASPSARPISGATVTRCTAGATALGGRSTGSLDPERVLRDYAAGLPFKVAQFEHALAVTGRSRAELRTQRASAKAGLAA